MSSYAVRTALARRIRASQLGYLGINPLEAQIASKGASLAAGAGATALIGTAAGSAGAAIFGGAAAGSVVPIVGTIIGAAVGLLTSMVFGHHANYQMIENNVGTRMKYAETYKQIAGAYPGRAYGVKDLTQVWLGLIDEGFFKMNGGACWSQNKIQSCIQQPNEANCPHCNAIEQWGTDLFDGHVAAPQFRSFNGAAKTALGQGLNAVQAADEIFIPHWSPSGSGVWIPWAAPQNTQIPSLGRQLIIDTLDAVMYGMNPNLPVSYGTLPASTQAAGGAGTGAAAAVAPTTAQVAATQAAQATSPAGVPVSGPAVSTTTGTPGVSIATLATPQSGATLPSTIAGMMQIGTDPSTGAPIYRETSSGADYEYVNGQLVPYTPTMVTGSGAPTTGGMNSNTLALIQSLLSQGQSQQQAYTSALESLASQGVNTQSPAVQSQVAQAVQNPSGYTAAMSAGGTVMGTNTTTLALLGVLAAGAVYIALKGRKSKSGKAS